MSSPTAQIAGSELRVIEAKLMPPRNHLGMLRRARLLEMLDDDGGALLTVLNATVGYGKTTLARSWCIERPEAVIWMTLDSADDDPVRLWGHLATAVERLGEGFGRRALSCLRGRGATVETAVDELMNGLVAYGRRVTVVLDDLHAVRSDASVQSISHAVGRLPPNARLVASTRSDPAIGLPRLRARGVLTEIRARELAFTVDETRDLVVREGIGLSSESVELLVDRGDRSVELRYDQGRGLRVSPERHGHQIHRQRGQRSLLPPNLAERDRHAVDEHEQGATLTRKSAHSHFSARTTCRSGPRSVGR